MLIFFLSIDHILENIAVNNDIKLSLISNSMNKYKKHNSKRSMTHEYMVIISFTQTAKFDKRSQSPKLQGYSHKRK